MIMKSKKIKLIMFEEKFGLGGIETFITNVLSCINREKFDVQLVTINKATDQYDSLFKKLDIPMVVLVPDVEINPIKRFKKGLPAFKTYLKQHISPDTIIHFNVSNSIDLLYVKIAKSKGIKVRIAHSHNSSATSNLKKLAHKMGMILLANTPNYYFTCSNLAASWLFPKKVLKNQNYYFIRNAIDTKKYQFNISKREQIRKKYGWTDNLVFGEVGRFNKQKNHKFLLETFKEIVQKRENAILVLVGAKDCLYDDIKSYAEELGIEKKVIFFGKTSKVADLLQAFDVFMLPSLYEGLPFVLVESQAAALSSLVSNTVTDEIKLTKYIVFDSLKNSPKEWADTAIKLTSVAREPDSTSLIKEGYDVNSMVKNLEQLYLKFYRENN